jgi:hypothetical protein
MRLAWSADKPLIGAAQSKPMPVSKSVALRVMRADLELEDFFFIFDSPFQ